ncbi:NAD(P)(+) transhydrogenase (Re/Si-specific) subunit beta [Sabulicella rubraurantiaca]
MATGYMGVEDELFFRLNITMLFRNAKKVTQQIVQALQAGQGQQTKRRLHCGL